MSKQKFYNGIDLKNNEIENVKKIVVTQDAENQSDLVRKSQAESIADASVQSSIVNSLSSPNSSTVLDTQQLKAQLDLKQVNMSVDPSSGAYIEIVDGYKLKIKELLNVTFEDLNFNGLASMLAGSTFNGDGTFTVSGKTIDKNTFIVLTGSSNQADKNYVYKGTNAGNSSDFINVGLDINVSTVRSMLSASGVGVSYDSGTGVYSLVFGTGASDLGGQTLPHGATFSTITPTNYVSSALMKLEELIEAVDQSGADGTATLEALINNRTGVTGTNYGTFTQGVFGVDKTGKQLFQESETLHKSAINDRVAIRSEFASADSTLQSNIDSEASTRANADSVLNTAIQSEAISRANADNALQSNIDTEATARATNDATLQANINSEASTRLSADNELQSNIDTEEASRISADNALQTQIDSLADSNIELVGTVDGSGVFNSVDGAGDGRNGQSFVSIAMKAGEEVVFSADVTLLGNDFKVNDKLMVKVATISAGSMALTDFVYKKGDGSDITKANLGSSTIELNGSDKLDIVADSVGRTQLDSSIEADIDDKVSLTADSQTITGKAMTFTQSDTNLGSSYGLYVNKTQEGTGALTGTARALLVENHVKSNGSGNPVLPNYAHNTIATHYKGSASDLSIVVSGAYNEANVSNSSSAIISNGSYSVSTDPQLGINIGSTHIAQNAGVSNISTFSFTKTGGVGADRAVVSAISNLDVVTYSGTRQADPFPYNDIALVADAKYSPAGSKALYAYGDSVFEGGSVTVPSASSDTDALNLGDLKATEECYKTDLVDGVAKTISSIGLDLDKCIIQYIHSNQDVVIEGVRDNVNNTLTVKATGDDLSDVYVVLKELSCSITIV